MKREYHILNLGAGVQSTTLYLMAMDGEIAARFDCAIFADTQDEPAGVYQHLEWLQSLKGPTIYVRTAGCLGDHLMRGENSTGQKFAAIPAFIANREGTRSGIGYRQCTNQYKIEVIERFVRREILGLKPRQAVPVGVVVHHYMGLSFDEPGRAARVRGRFKQIRWGEVHFPLFDEGMTRGDCQRYLDNRVPHTVPKSACVFCPYRPDSDWRRMRESDPAAWRRAVEVDEGLRSGEAREGRMMEGRMYLHRSCVPLSVANLGRDEPTLFDMECEGGCGL